MRRRSVREVSMIEMKRIAPFVAASLLVAACGPRTHGARSPTAATTTPPPPTTVNVATNTPPLPAGWAWPFDATAPNNPFAGLGVERPFDLSAVSALKGTSRCAPFEAAPNVWIAPVCGPATPAIPSTLAMQAMPPPKTVLPLSVDLRAMGLDGPVKSQQMVGVCWTFAMSTLVENALHRSGRTDVVAPLHLLSTDAFRGLWSNKPMQPLVPEASWPYDPVKACKLNDDPGEVWCDAAYHVKHGSWHEDAALVAEVDHANATGLYRIVDARDAEQGPVLPQSIASEISDGRAVYADFDIDTVAWDYKHVVAGRIPDWGVGGAGHGVALVAYRTTPTGREFLVHNSWGSSWGENGYAWVSEAMIVAHVRQAFVLEVQVVGASPAPVPSLPPKIDPKPLPTPAPTTDCGAGKVRDLVFGACVAPCASGGAPIAGLCADAPSTPTAKSCPSGTLPDWATGTCSAQCATGLPPVDGMCWP